MTALPQDVAELKAAIAELHDLRAQRFVMDFANSAAEALSRVADHVG